MTPSRSPLFPAEDRSQFVRPLAGLLGLAGSAALYAQPPLPAGTITTKANATFIHQFDSDLDEGGDVGVSSASLKFEQTHSLGENRSIGWGVDYTANFFSFEGDTGLGSLDPWDTINVVGLSGSYASPLGEEWDFRIAPAITAAGESSASVGDSLTYGGIFTFTHTFSEKLTMGLGAGVYTGIEDTQAFPILAVRWEFAPGWTLQNPLRPGPAGPAGLEIALATGDWEFGFGGAYRSYRFRLADDGSTPDGIGEYTAVPVFLRASRAIAPNFTINLYGGAMFGGSIDLENSNGGDLADSDFDPAPILAISLSGRF